MNRVCIVTPFYIPHIGGMERALARLAGALRRTGWGVEVFTTGPEPENEDHGVVRVDGPLEEWARHVPALLARLDPARDVVLFSSFGPGTAVAQLQAGRHYLERGGHTVWRSPTADHASRNLRSMADQAALSIGSIVANSGASAQMTRAALPGIPVQVVPNMLLPEEINVHWTQALTPREIDFAWAGRVEPRKKPIELALLFNHLTRSGYTVAVQPVCSYRREAGFSEFLKTLDARVEVHPAATEVAERIARASVFVHTSSREGSPNSVLEAASRGQAILVSDIPECTELLHGLPGIGRLPENRHPEDADLLSLLSSGGTLSDRCARATAVHARHGSTGVIDRWCQILHAPK